MFRGRFKHFGLTVLLLLLMQPTSLFAGWMGFRNDTEMTLLIQETVQVNNMPRPGKLQRLFNGEAIRDMLVGPSTGVRRFTIYDAQNPKKPLLSDNFPTPRAEENVTYAIQPDGKGGLKIVPISTKK